jgi:hypothetical protein
MTEDTNPKIEDTNSKIEDLEKHTITSLYATEFRSNLNILFCGAIYFITRYSLKKIISAKIIKPLSYNNISLLSFCSASMYLLYRNGLLVYNYLEYENSEDKKENINSEDKKENINSEEKRKYK